MGKGGVLALRESRRLCGFAARTIGAGAVYALDDIPGDSPPLPRHGRRSAAPRGMTLRSCSRVRKGRSGTASLRPSTTRDAAGRPFVAVHCGGIPRSLMRSELFGFDGEGGRPGKCELADGGTLFLDGVEALP